MTTTWYYIEYNSDTELWDVLKQERSISEDVVMRSFKREYNAVDFKFKLMMD